MMRYSSSWHGNAQNGGAVFAEPGRTVRLAVLADASVVVGKDAYHVTVGDVARSAAGQHTLKLAF